MVATKFNAKGKGKNNKKDSVEKIIEPKITEQFKVSKSKSKTSKSKASPKKPKEPKKPKRAINRFNGMSEEEVAKKGLPDYLQHGLDIVFIGINPSLMAAYSGKYYDGPGNHFWQALYLSGFLPQPMTAQDDSKLLDLKMGFTNIVPRTTRGLSDLTTKEIVAGKAILKEKLEEYKPKIAVFNGKKIYEVYSANKKFIFGRQPEPMNNGATWIWVMPSSSARLAQLPRAIDKVPFFEALKKFRDYLNGQVDKVEDCEVTFASVVLKNWAKGGVNSIKVEKPDEEDENAQQEMENGNGNEESD